MSQQCPPRRGWAGTAQLGPGTHTVLSEAEKRSQESPRGPPLTHTHTKPCLLCPTWPTLGPLGAQQPLPCCLLSVGSLKGSETPGPERNQGCCLELRRKCARHGAGCSLDHPDSLPSDGGLGKSNEELEHCSTSTWAGPESQDRCTDTCEEVRGEAGG